MLDIKVKDTEPQDVIELSKNLRDIDKEELLASHGHTPLEALRQGYIISSKCYSIFLEDKIVAIFGVSPNYAEGNLEEGIIWLLGNDNLDKIQLSFLKGCNDYIEDMKEGFTSLKNYVYSENIISINWLKWLGFKIHEAEPYGLENKLFHKFTMEV